MMRNGIRRLACGALGCVVLLAGCGKREGTGSGAAAARQSDRLELYVPCAFAPPVTQIVKSFKKQHPNLEIVQRVENVEVLAPRIADGRTPDVFMCVGDVEMDTLEKAGKVEQREDFCFVGLALVVPEDNPANVTGLADLAKPEVKTVAVGAEGTSPGHYARDLLTSSGLWDKVAPKTVAPKFPAQLLRFAGMGKADASIAYAACLRAGRGDWAEQENYQKLAQGVRLVTWLDEGEYCLSIPCAAATIKGCSNPTAGRAFIDFLLTDEAQDYLKKSGFTGLSEPKCFR